MNWTKKLSRFAPPGDDLRTAFIAYVLALLVFVVFWGLGFFSGYRQALRELYEFRYGALVLRNGAVMASLNSLIRTGSRGSGCICSSAGSTPRRTMRHFPGRQRAFTS